MPEDPSNPKEILLKKISLGNFLSEWLSTLLD
jgi:hypothetical protein